MKRLVSDTDFHSAAPLIRDSRRLNRWGVCTWGYELQLRRRNGLNDHVLRAKHPLELTDADGLYWKTYKPLEEHPNLFLRFARLSRQSASPERALDWCQKYGVLGLAGGYQWGWTGENNAHQRYESLEAFDAEVDRAAGVLALYEAALNRDSDAVEYFVFEKHPLISAELYGSSPGQYWNSSLISEMVETHGGGDYLTYSLEAATWIVEMTVRESCYPTLRAEGSRNPSDVTGGWGFKNLRGAMYLQMYWLMAAGGNIARCKNCGGVIALSRSLPEGRKPRQDKTFCGDACRQRYHYHNRTKPRRTGKRP